MAKIRTKEWMGTIIDLVNSSTQMELRIDGRTVDSYRALIAKSGTILRGTNSQGDRIRVDTKVGLLGTKVFLYFNDRQIEEYLIITT